MPKDALGGIGAAVAAMLLQVACTGDGTTFDKAAWDNGRGQYDTKNPRLDLVEPARDAGVRVGTRREAIRAILGTPDDEATEADLWFLGRDDLAPNVRLLVVDYDASGVATRVINRKP